MNKFCKFVDSKKDVKCETSADSNSLKVTVECGSTDNMVLMPVIYSENWKITVNGKEVNSKQKTGVCGLFTGVTVTPGQENTIEMTFDPKGRKEGLLISIAVLAIIAIFGLFKLKKNYIVPVWLRYCAGFVYVELINAVAVFMFLIPVIAAIPAVIYQIIMKILW